MPNEGANTSDHSAHIRELKQKRRIFKSQLTMFGKWVEAYDDSAKERVKLRDRIDRLRNQFNTFNLIQDELCLLENFEEAETEREATIETYDDVMSIAVVLLEQVEARTVQPTIASNNSPASSSSQSSPYALSVKLPKIDLPKFDGRIETWITVKDAFHTLIHTQPGLSKIQKLHYLRLSLSGKAEAAVRAFSITEDNYEAAWNHINEIYDNKRALVLRHTALLLYTPAMPDDSSESIRDLANHMQLHLRSLQALGRSSDDIANDLLTSILISRMAIDTRKSWERTLSDTEVPKIDDLFKFLNNASHQSKDYDANPKFRPTVARTHNYGLRTQPPPQKRQVYVTNTSRNASTPPSSPRTQRRSTPSSRGETKRTGYTTAKCPVCEGTHPVYQCPPFFELTVSRRIEAARKAHLCLNCLQSDHRAEDCKAGKCRVCNQQHNTKLHQEPHPATDS
ncbi:uncharacterized protein LOC123987907 [Osmia bicornis bicornis]|uniref:uncharacterized protein LOC123987907 n=1 Tax=Osmia bicornis bicornis TaxID=1437191 RepID=UPI001EAF1C98|nr:uncharacterized protein LOC123987907 [Osmia bicornis bicornis]